MAKKSLKIMWDSDNALVKALAVSGYCIGLSPNSKEDKEVCIDGHFMDAYLMTIVLAQRIAAGDVEIVEKDDSTNYKEYYNRLLESCGKLNIKMHYQEPPTDK